jgi:hypothetical protein
VIHDILKDVTAPERLVRTYAVGIMEASGFTGTVIRIYDQGRRVVKHYVNGALHHPTEPALLVVDEGAVCAEKWFLHDFCCRDEDQHKLLRGHVVTTEVCAMGRDIHQAAPYTRVRIDIGDVSDSVYYEFDDHTVVHLRNGRSYELVGDYHTDIQFIRGQQT